MTNETKQNSWSKKKHENLKNMDIRNVVTRKAYINNIFDRLSKICDYDRAPNHLMLTFKQSYRR